MYGRSMGSAGIILKYRWWRSIEKWDLIIHLWIFLPLLGKSISGFLWGNYFLGKKVSSIFDFEKIPNSTGIALKRLEGLWCRDYTI